MTTKQNLMTAHINAMRDLCHGYSLEGGWYTDLETGEPIKVTIERTGLILMLITTEIAEAMEGIRKNQMDDHLPHRRAGEVELADAFIRILDLAGWLGYDLGGAVFEKISYNRTRADHKLENRKAEGGKKA